MKGILSRQRQAIEELDAANKRLREMNRQIDDSSRYASLLLQSTRPGPQLSELFVMITITCSGSHAIMWVAITVFSTVMINDVLPVSLTALAMACRGR